MTLPTASETLNIGAQWGTISGVPTRKKIEDLLKRRAALDHGFKELLVSRPFETYTNFVVKLCGGLKPDYMTTIQEIRVFEEGERDIYFVLRDAA